MALLTETTGYCSRDYALSLAEFGEPMELPHCGGWLLARTIPGSGDRDAMGAYPYFCCRDWQQLGADFAAHRQEIVAASLVADPFGNHDEKSLRATFDVVTPFKSHFVVDTALPVDSYASATHRKFARRAQRRLSIEVCADPPAMLDAWTELYGHLVHRHNISGIRAFSRRAFDQQLRIPGMVMFCAKMNAEVVGFDLWYVQGDVAHGHLTAMTREAYGLHTGYGLKLSIIEYFKDKVRWLNLGGGAGVDAHADDGLTAFKRGWASGTRTAWFCGRILQPERYRRILVERNVTPNGYFPAYRQGEFA